MNRQQFHRDTNRPLFPPFDQHAQTHIVLTANPKIPSTSLTPPNTSSACRIGVPVLASCLTLIGAIYVTINTWRFRYGRCLIVTITPFGNFILEAKMNKQQYSATILLSSWQNGEVTPPIPDHIKPHTPEDGYAIQNELARMRDEPVVGWKIAATSQAGRNHIGVDRPLAGRLYSSIVFSDNAIVPLASNRMLVAEAEIVLGLSSDLKPLAHPRSEKQVAEAVGSMHAGLELPDSRFRNFTTAGTACLIADNACARHFVLGEAVTPPADLALLAHVPTKLMINGTTATNGLGSDALGGPLTALTWLVNTINALGITIKAGEFVTTGVTGRPSVIQAGDKLEALVSDMASVNATITA